MTALALKDEPSFSILGQVGRVYLTPPPDWTIAQWVADGEKLIEVREEIQFLLGDLVLEGYRRFGEEAAALFDGRNQHTLRKCKQVCALLPPDMRRADLSFSHHEAVTRSVNYDAAWQPVSAHSLRVVHSFRLDPNEKVDLLARAKTKGWDRDQLRAEVDRRIEAKELAARAAADAERVRAQGEVIPPRPVGLVKAGDVDRRPGEESADEVAPEPEHETAPSNVSIFPPPKLTETMETSAVYLHGTAKTTHSVRLRDAINDVLEERETLRHVYDLAKRAVAVGQITPELAAAVA